MPWHTQQGHSDCPDGKPWAVVKDSDGSVEGCHETEADADKQMAALYANEPEASADAEALGGKPNPGTDPDKRLKENDPRKKKRKGYSLTDAMDLALKLGRTPTDEELEVLGDEPEDEEEDPAEVVAAAKTATKAAWKGTICVEGVLSGDQRTFSEGALTWADPPIPLRWKKEDAHGGQNDVTVAVGTITSIERVGNEIIGEGVFDLGSEDGREVHRRLKDGMHTGGISIDADDITDADVELIWPENPETDGPADELALLFANPERIVFHAGRIRAATLCDIPAFVEARIALTAAADITIPDDLEPATVLDQKVRGEIHHQTLLAAGVEQVTDLTRPPREWFADPKLSLPMNVIVTDEGRVYGHVAHWDECHIGHPDMCVTPPYEERHDCFMTGEVVCSDGSRVKVGQVTLGTGHAPLAYSAQRAAEHYDNTGTAVADVAIGNDEHGIWLAGALRHGLDQARIRELRAAGKVSGDWRRIGGSLRMVGLLAVNVGGFGYKVRSRVTSGKQMALVSAGVPKIGSVSVEIEQAAMRFLMERMAREIHGTEANDADS